MTTPPSGGFEEYAAARWLALVRAGISLGCGLTQAEDLAQTTLVRCYVAWAKVSRAEHRDAYVSRILVNAHRETHRRWGRRETTVAVLPESVAPDETDRVDTTDALRRAVAVLSPGQREVVALRFYLRLSEAQIAEALGIAPGTVKSRLSRALTLLSADPGLIELREGKPHDR